MFGKKTCKKTEKDLENSWKRLRKKTCKRPGQDFETDLLNKDIERSRKRLVKRIGRTLKMTWMAGLVKLLVRRIGKTWKYLEKNLKT